jgi:DNA-directed RNA polymerase subunit L
MASLTVKKNTPFMLDVEFQHFPLTFINALRRILVGNYLPQVMLSGIEILNNTTQMPHEMIKHRVGLLPVAVQPDDAETIKNATVSLVVTPIPDKDRLITTDDFKIEKGPSSLIMKDRDLNKPLLFIKVRKAEEIHLECKLALEKGSHVCTASYKYHVDPDRLKVDRETFLKREGADPREFDNFYYQKSYSVDEHGRPNWVDFQVESVGVIKSKELLKMANVYLRKNIDEWVAEGLENISRESEKNVYSVNLKRGDHTEGALLQEMIYHGGKTGFVSYDILHPLLKDLSLKWISESAPEEVLKEVQKKIHEYSDIVEKAL